MKYLCLSHNQLGEKGGQHLAPAIGSRIIFCLILNSNKIKRPPFLLVDRINYNEFYIVCKESCQTPESNKNHVSLGVFWWTNFVVSRLICVLKRNSFLWFKIVCWTFSLFFLSAANDTIDHLDLSWNHLRNKGACAVALSLKVC